MQLYIELHYLFFFVSFIVILKAMSDMVSIDHGIESLKQVCQNVQWAR